MRNQWRSILRNNILSTPRISRPLLLNQVNSSVTPTSSFTAFISTSPILPTFKNPTFASNFDRFYSTEQPIKGISDETSLVISIFSNPIKNHDDIKKELESNHVVVSSDLINEVLKHLGSEISVGIKLFDWVSENDEKNVILDSNSYNLMLGILGGNGLVKEFWGLIDVMKKKGFGVKRGAFERALERFVKDDLKGDVEKLNGLFAKSTSLETLSSRINRIVRREAWGESVENDLKGLDVRYTSELVKMVLEKLAFKPMKGLLFFMWVKESGLFKHDQSTYNAMAIVLGRGDCIDRFWGVVGDMRDAGFEMEARTYVKVLGRLIDRKLMKDAVCLYEFLIEGTNKPSREDCTFLLKKLAVAKELDMELFCRVVKAFTEKGSTLEDCMLDTVLKSLTSVGRMNECKKVLDAMIEVGFAPSGAMQARVAYDLSSSKLKDESDEYMKNLDGHGMTPNYKAWSSLIEGHCVAADFDKARECFDKMVEKEGVRHVGYALDMLVNAYCERFRGAEACKMLSEIVNNNSSIEPWHVTYKTLIKKLLGQRGFQDALPLLGLMKRHGFPPFVEPFVGYLSKKGTPEDAMQFFKAVTVKKYPSRNIYLQVFEAYSKAGSYKQAQDLLAKCPQYIRNHADVLNIFCSMKSKVPAKAKAASVEPAKSKVASVAA